MKIRLYNYYKIENSTAQPGESGGYEYEVTLKNDTSIVAPEVIIDFADQDDPQPHIFNYAYIPDFNRYYFVSDARVLRGVIWEYSLSVDILATYRQVISNQYLYLLRCSRDYDGAVVDTYYPVKTTFSTEIKTINTPWLHSNDVNPDIDQGCFILGIVSRPGDAVNGVYGSVSYIAMTRDNLAKLVNFLMDGNNMDLGEITVEGVTNEAMKAIIDPLTFIKSCTWCPILYENIESVERTGLEIWSWHAYGVKFKNILQNPPYWVWSASFQGIPRHPLAASRGEYLNTEPYTKMSLYVPPFGLIDLDTTLMAGIDVLASSIIYDFITGTAILETRYGVDGPVACRMESKVGVDIQLTQVTRDYMGAVTSLAGGALSVIGSIVTGQVAGAIMGGASAIGSAVSAMRPSLSSMGGSGGFIDLRGRAALIAIFHDVPEEDRAHVGRPLCREVYMGTMAKGAYCLAMDGDIAINGTAGEQARLKQYLESGFYYV